MDIKKIKQRADEVLLTNKPQFIRILLILTLIGLIPSLFSSQSGTLATFLYWAVNLFFISFSHGYIVSSLKMVRNQSHLLSDDDAFVGFKRYKELFPTYLLSNFMILLFSYIIVFVLTLLLGIVIGTAAPDFMVSDFQSGGSFLLSLFSANLSLIIIFLIFYLVIVALVFVVSSYLFAMPYLLERYHFKATVSLKTSYRMMKGYLWDFIKLQLSFILWILIILVVQSLLSEFLAFLPIIGTLIASIIGGVLAIYTYLPRYYLSRTIFFEELAYRYFDQNTQTNSGEENHV